MSDDVANGEREKVMTMTRGLIAPSATAKKTMRGVIFTVLISGQRHKHENELKRLGFDVESRDFPKSFNLNAYEVIFIVKDHAPNNEQENAEKAARLSGKPWFRITKKTSNPTWEAVKTFARKQGLAPVEDADSHEPSLSVKPFAVAGIAGFGEYLAKKADADDWAKLAGEYETAAKAAEERAESLETMWKAAEVDLKEMRKRLQTAIEDANSAAAEREALRRESERLGSLLAAKATGRKAVAAVDDGVLRRLQDTDTLLRQARAERNEVKEELAKRMKLGSQEQAEAKKIINGLQDTIDELTKTLAAKPTSTALAAPPGKKLVPANIVETAEKLYSLWEDGVLDIEEVWQKLMTQLKGD